MNINMDIVRSKDGLFVLVLFIFVFRIVNVIMNEADIYTACNKNN